MSGVGYSVSMSIVQRHPYFSLLNSWEKTQLLSLLDELDKKCDLVLAKTSDLSDITLISLRFQCQLGYKPPQFLSLVEIDHEIYYTRLQYFADTGFTVVRLVMYEPKKLSRIKNLDRAVPVLLEIYLLPQ